MGEPGALPMLNQALVAAAIKAGRAFDCTIADTAKFDRKLYFYPDTPKNYQITQHRRPIASKGMFRMLSGNHMILNSYHMIYLICTL
jgi:aspartyl-tRNA(Asn)/glutamyl-tRNA(Gln) amidotransferase subunit B